MNWTLSEIAAAFAIAAVDAAIVVALVVTWATRNEILVW